MPLDTGTVGRGAIVIGEPRVPDREICVSDCRHMGQMLEHRVGLGRDRKFLQALRHIAAARDFRAADIFERAVLIEVAAHANGNLARLALDQAVHRHEALPLRGDFMRRVESMALRQAHH